MDLSPLVADSYVRLADALEARPAEDWDAPSLCSRWRVREVVSHVSMPARMSQQDFGAEMAAFHGDFQALSDHVASRDSSLPLDVQLANLRSDTLAAWQPPGGGAIGALNHAVVHGLDITNALGLPRACDDDTARVILDDATEGSTRGVFGVDPEGLRLAATDLDWTWGHGQEVSATAGELISMLCHRTLPDGRTLHG